MDLDNSDEYRAAAATDDHGLEGSVVAGRYRVLRKLGEGGMGIVYLAEHITIEKKVALKVLLHEYARKADLKDRFLQEAKAAARIGHENIVDITDFGTTPDASVFFAMEYLEGQDLSHLIKQQGPVPWNRAKPIVVQICRALGAAHSKGIVHRDMKPENIHLIEREGRPDFVKVLDFGIAKMSVEDSGKRLTRTGMIFGTPEYMSPEQAQGNQPDHRVDIYAVGVIMYEMLTGTVPFKADTFMGILTKHIFENPVPPSKARADVQIPAEVEAIVLRALAKDREERFQSMTEMAAAMVQASGRLTRPTGDNPAVAPRRFGMPSHDHAGPAMTSARGTIDPHAPLAIDLDNELPGRRIGPRLLLVGLLAAAVVAGAAVTATLVKRGDAEQSNAHGAVALDAGGATLAQGSLAAPDAAASRRQHVRVRINSTPSGAEVFMGAPTPDKKPAGETPMTLELPRGEGKSRALTIRLDGFEEQRQFVTTGEDSELKVVMKRETAAPARRAGAVSSRRRRDVRQPKRRVITLPVKKTPAKPPARKKSGNGSATHLNDLMDPFGGE